MRHTRTALALLFVRLAIIVVPDGVGRIFIKLEDAETALVVERNRQKKEAER